MLWVGMLLFMSMSAQANDPKNLSISYVIYPQVDRYLRLINEVYTELGYRVTMIPTPATRGLKLLNDGEFDADALRLKSMIAKYPNVIAVEPPLIVGKLILLCIENVVCDHSVLAQKNAVILTTEGIIPYLADYNVQAQLEVIPLFPTILTMIKAQRVSFALFVGDESIEALKNYKQVALQDITIYHAINKKHADLLPLIQQKIREKQTQLMLHD